MTTAVWFEDLNRAEVASAGGIGSRRNVDAAERRVLLGAAHRDENHPST